MGFSIQATQVLIIGFISAPLAIIALGLRLWSRRLQGIPFAFNDYMAALATLLAVATASVCLGDAFIGAIGAHTETLQATSPQILELYIKLTIPGQILWASANTCVKLSILSLYTIIFPGKTFRRICYASMVVSVAYFLANFLNTFLWCKPVQYNWDKTIPNGVCYNQSLAYLLVGIFNLLIDAFIVVLPAPKLYRLKIPLPKRIAIGAMFCLGAIICILSLLRVFSVLSWDLNDPTYTGTGITIYSILEPTLGVVNACLPTTKPALRKLSTYCSCSSKTRRKQHSLAEKFAHQYRFERLGDDIAQTNSLATSSQQAGRYDGNNIVVMREWEVSLSHTRASHAQELEA